MFDFYDKGRVGSKELSEPSAILKALEFYS